MGACLRNEAKPVFDTRANNRQCTRVPLSRPSDLPPPGDTLRTYSHRHTHTTFRSRHPANPHCTTGVT